MASRQLTDASSFQLDRLVKPLLAARLFADEASLRAVHRARPWAVQANAHGDVAVLDRWRDHLDMLAIEALWCPHRHISAAIAGLAETAAAHGFSGLVSPPVHEADVPVYEAAGMAVRDLLETLDLALPAPTADAPTGTLAAHDRMLPRDAAPVLRRALEGDVTAILTVDGDCFEPFWRYDHRHIARFCAAGEITIAEREGRCLGYTLVTVDRGSAVLGRLCVDEPFRRSGVGTRLLRTATCDARGAGARHVTLSAQGDNSGALELYRTAGFRYTGRRYAFLTLGSEIRGGEGDRVGPLMGD